MSGLAISVIAIVALLVLMALRVPIAIALGGVSLVGLTAVRGPNAALGIFGNLPMEFGASWSLSTIPMFLLMGSVAYHSGMTASLFSAARLWLGNLPGGLAVATNFAAAGFAAASGSSLATSAAMGRLAIPEMLKAKYDPGLATGCVAAAGTLGALIPPSIMFVIYGWYTQTSIGQLLIAGIVPGLLTAGIYSAMIIIRCRAKPELAPPLNEVVDWNARFRVLLTVWPIPVLVFFVIGSIFSGLATATEAGALGAFFAFVIAGLRGGLTMKVARDSIVEALGSTATIFFVAISALLFTRFLAFAGLPSFLAQQVALLGLDPLVLTLGFSIIYLILGMFLDPLGVLLLTLPVVFPIMKQVGMDPLWMGVILVKYLEIGMITPPVGLNVYVVNSVVGKLVPLPTIFRGVMWFLAAEIVIMALLIAFPSISTFLPSLM
ncbi:MAG: TRAP transporter large permease [Vannielia sp.]|uniref:TRAP transporter large permease n=1 Tax=Vannielia sp. TaxID=2813045 RepID=UPI003B8CE169